MPGFATLLDSFINRRGGDYYGKRRSRPYQQVWKSRRWQLVLFRGKKVYRTRTWITIFGDILSTVRKCSCKPTKITQITYLKEPPPPPPPKKKKKSSHKQKQTNTQTNQQKTTKKKEKFLPDKFLGSLKSHSLWSSRLITGFHSDSIPYIRCR